MYKMTKENAFNQLMQKKTPRITAKLDPKSIFNHKKLNMKIIPLKVKQEILSILSDLKQL